jgi:nucleotide-binding universal stress UspA family protein
MALKDLLVYVDQSQSALVRLRLAADLARRHSSRLTALYVRESDRAQLHEQSTAEFGCVSSEQINQTNQHISQSIDETEERWRSALEAIHLKHGIDVELRCLDGTGSALFLQHARFADLCIIGQSVPIDATSVGYTFSEELLFVTGRPVLFVPAAGSFDTLGKHILVAWNSSRASARALNDSLPLIERAERTTVLAVNSTEYVERYGALPPERIVEHLRRHSPVVEGVWLGNVPTGSIADVLQAEAHRVGADMLVAGAFGHPKLWEKLMGGVTRDLLARMTLPILMST